MIDAAATTTSQPPWGTRRPGRLAAGWIALCRRLPPGPVSRRLGLWLRRPLKYRLAGPVDTQLWGLRLRLHPRGNLSEERWLFLPQFSDRIERRLLAARLAPGAVFLDVGANAGFYSFWAWSHLRDAVRIEAFEPDPELCARIRFNVAANAIRSLHLHQLALSDRAGTARLAIGAKNRGTNALTDGDGGVEVPTVPLAGFVADAAIGRIDAMKIDVEGHEPAILGHFFAHAPRSAFPRLLVCETLAHQARTDPLRALIESAGYRQLARGRMNTVFELAPRP